MKEKNKHKTGSTKASSFFKKLNKKENKGQILMGMKRGDININASEIKKIIR